MKILGLTGGSGTGKSAACTAFARLGCGVIDADATYRTLCDTCEPMLKEIQNVFGDVFSTDGKLDRQKARRHRFCRCAEAAAAQRDYPSVYSAGRPRCIRRV